MTKAGDFCVRFCTALNRIPAALLCVLLFVTQSAVIDYYLVHHINNFHLCWIIADVFNLILLVICIYQANSKINLLKKNVDANVFSIAWISWLAMNVSVMAKVIVIFMTFGMDLEEEEPSFFGPNTLKTAIAIGSGIFLLLLTTQHESPLKSEQRRYIEELTGTVVFDILDTVDVLDVLFDEESRPLLWKGLEEGILAVATLNLLIPTVPLYTLRRTKFGREKLRKRLIYLHRVLVVLAVNVPNLLVRLILWHGFSVGISPFTVKNIILIGMTLFEFYEHKKEKFEEHAREFHEMSERSEKRISGDSRDSSGDLKESKQSSVDDGSDHTKGVEEHVKIGRGRSTKLMPTEDKDDLTFSVEQRFMTTV